MVNKLTEERKFTLQSRFLFWWLDCYREIGWGCCEVITTATYDECKKEQQKIEANNSWYSVNA